MRFLPLTAKSCRRIKPVEHLEDLGSVWRIVDVGVGHAPIFELIAVFRREMFRLWDGQYLTLSRSISEALWLRRTLSTHRSPVAQFRTTGDRGPVTGPKRTST